MLSGALYQKDRIMAKIGTPSNIEILLHCHCCPEPHPRRDAPAVKQTLEKFMVMGVIQKASDSDMYTTTQLGAMWVQALRNTELPQIKYFDNNGNEL